MARFFRERRLLVEVTIIWPRNRDEAAERAILAAVAVQDPEAAVHSWRASGLDAAVGQFGLEDLRRRVGGQGFLRRLPAG